MPTSLQNGFRFEEIPGTEWVPRTYELRYRVWAREKQLFEAIERLGLIRDDHDGHARHWGVFSDYSNVVASARLCIHDKQEDVPDGDYYDFNGVRFPAPVASLNRLVVEISRKTVVLQSPLMSAESRLPMRRGCLPDWCIRAKSH